MLIYHPNQTQACCYQFYVYTNATSYVASLQNIDLIRTSLYLPPGCYPRVYSSCGFSIEGLDSSWPCHQRRSRTGRTSGDWAEALDRWARLMLQNGIYHILALSSIHLSVYPSVSPSLYSSIYPFIHPSFTLNIWMHFLHVCFQQARSTCLPSTLFTPILAMCILHMQPRSVIV